MTPLLVVVLQQLALRLTVGGTGWLQAMLC